MRFCAKVVEYLLNSAHPDLGRHHPGIKDGVPDSRTRAGVTALPRVRRNPQKEQDEAVACVIESSVPASRGLAGQGSSAGVQWRAMVGGIHGNPGDAGNVVSVTCRIYRPSPGVAYPPASVGGRASCGLSFWEREVKGPLPGGDLQATVPTNVGRNSTISSDVLIYPPQADLVQHAFAADGGRCDDGPPRLKRSR
jgi:hypothetical protein